MLLPIKGKTLIQHTWEAALKIDKFSKVVIAVDSEELYNHVLTFTSSSNCIMTSKLHTSGTSRLTEVYKTFTKQGEHYDLWLNWQGDEPFLSNIVINDFLKSYEDTFDIFTLRTNIKTYEELLNKNVVKVVVNSNNKALYFSRSVIPYKDFNCNTKNLPLTNFYKHIGLYMFTSNSLSELYTNGTECFLETYEKLEQLNFLYNGFDIKVSFTDYESHSIDTFEDLKFFETYFN